MSDDPQLGAGTAAAGNPHVDLAQALAKQVVKGRLGIGSFRKLKGLRYDTAGLVLESSVFEQRAIPGMPSICGEEELFFHFSRHLSAPGWRYLVEQVLVRPNAFDPTGMWVLFWALLKGEHQFLEKYVPYWSHEERLTGHFVSQIIERVEEFAQHWRTLSGQYTIGERPLCRIYYADIATEGRERSTGGDLALIVQCRFEWHDEFFKVVRFQAKKARRNGKATLELDQIGPLTATEGLGYYLFYHRLDPNGWTPTPTVRQAREFHDLLEPERTQKGRNLGTKNVDARSNGYDFASFVTFAVCDPGSEHGVLTISAADALRMAMSTTGGSKPSRVLVIRLGANATDVSWHDLLREHSDVIEGNVVED